MSQDQKEVRRDYARGELRRSDLPTNPMTFFEQWLSQASEAELVDATAMTLATVSASGEPSVRIVLLKHFDESGYAWYTSYASQKGEELALNPKASLLFYWREFERQVRLTGRVERVSAEESAHYFHSRPLDSQFSAAASEQSKEIESRAALEDKVRMLQQAHGEEVPVPQNWGGYRLVPHTYEFWQGRVGRLHDRFRYRQKETGWDIDRLQP